MNRFSFLYRCTLLATALIFMAGCGNDDEEEFPNFVGLKGRVLVQNEFGQPLYQDRSGIRAVLETGFQSFNVQADNIGYWQRANCPAGRYTVTYTKNGCGTLVFRDVMVSTTTPRFPIENGFQRLPTPTLTVLPNANFQNVALNLTTGQNGSATTYDLSVTGTIIPGPPPTGQAKGYRVFIGRSPNVSRSNYEFQQHYTTLTANFTAEIGNAVFQQLNVQAGQVFYVVIHGDANFDLSLTNPNGTLTFPNLTAEPSSTASVVLP